MPGVYSFSCQMGAEGLVPGTCEVHADNVSQEYGDVYVIEKAFRPEDYIIGNEGVNLRVEQIRVTKEMRDADIRRGLTGKSVRP